MAIPTFYVQRSGGAWEVTCRNSDSPNGNVLLARWHDKKEAISKAKRKYYGPNCRNETPKIVHF